MFMISIIRNKIQSITKFFKHQWSPAYWPYFYDFFFLGTSTFWKKDVFAYPKNTVYINHREGARGPPTPTPTPLGSPIMLKVNMVWITKHGWSWFTSGQLIYQNSLFVRKTKYIVRTYSYDAVSLVLSVYIGHWKTFICVPTWFFIGWRFLPRDDTVFVLVK